MHARGVSAVTTFLLSECSAYWYTVQAALAVEQCGRSADKAAAQPSVNSWWTWRG